MLNEFIFYAALASAIMFGATWLVLKDRGVAWLVSVLVGIGVISFVFPSPAAARTIGDVPAILRC